MERQMMKFVIDGNEVEIQKHHVNNILKRFKPPTKKEFGKNETFSRRVSCSFCQVLSSNCQMCPLGEIGRDTNIPHGCLVALVTITNLSYDSILETLQIGTLLVKFRKDQLTLARKIYRALVKFSKTGK